MKSKILIVLLLIIAALLFSPTLVLAQQGCCSYHQGVDRCDSSIGRIVCNDGDYSPTCRCQIDSPQPPTLPLTIRGYSDFTQNQDKTVNLTFSWSDLKKYEISGVSIYVTQYVDSEPDNLIDTRENSWTFGELNPDTKYYVFLKGYNNSDWTSSIYWTITTPEWVAPTSSPTPILVVTPVTTIIPLPTSSPTSNKSFFSWILNWFYSLGKTPNVEASDFSLFAKGWSRHGFVIEVNSDGTGEAGWRIYKWCSQDPRPPCDQMESNHITAGGKAIIELSSISGRTAYGQVISTNESETLMVAPLTLTIMEYGMLELNQGNSKTILCGPDFGDLAPESLISLSPCGA